MIWQSSNRSSFLLSAQTSVRNDLLWVKDADYNLGGISGARHSKSGPSNGDHLTLVKSSTLAFWDKYLKSERAAKNMIDSGVYNEASQGMVKWSER